MNRPGNPNWIKIQYFDSALAMQFPEAPLFNRVYNFDKNSLDSISDLVSFFAKENHHLN